MTQMPDPQTRIGDTERAEAQRLLAEHLEAGRLSTEEYGERAALAGVARCAADLLPLFADLPGHQRAANPMIFAPQQPLPHAPRGRDITGPVQALAIAGGIFVAGCVGVGGLMVLNIFPYYRLTQLVAVAAVLASMVFVALGLVRLLRPSPPRPYDQQGG